MLIIVKFDNRSLYSNINLELIIFVYIMYNIVISHIYTLQIEQYWCIMFFKIYFEGMVCVNT